MATTVDKNDIVRKGDFLVLLQTKGKERLSLAFHINQVVLGRNEEGEVFLKVGYHKTPIIINSPNEPDEVFEFVLELLTKEANSEG